jgi:hypothetical protein
MVVRRRLGKCFEMHGGCLPGRRRVQLPPLGDPGLSTGNTSSAVTFSVLPGQACRSPRVSKTVADQIVDIPAAAGASRPCGIIGDRGGADEVAGLANTDLWRGGADRSR